MKKFTYVILTAAAMFATVACSKELEKELNEDSDELIDESVSEESSNLVNPIQITFSANASTKVSLSGEGTEGEKTAVWDDGDQIKIIWYNGEMKSAIATADSHGSATANFTATVEDVELYYAVYPSTIDATLDSEGNFTVYFPTGSAASTTFGGAAWYAAKTTKADKAFAFHPLSAVIKLTLDGGAVADPTQVYFRSVGGTLHRLCGHAAVSFSDLDGSVSLAPVIDEGTGKSDGAGNVWFSITGAGTYYIRIPGYGLNYTYQNAVAVSPGSTGSDGFILSIQKAKKDICAAYYSAEITQEAGKFYNIKNPVDGKVIKNYYVARTSQGTGDGLSQANAATLTYLKANVPAFKYSAYIAGALLLNGTTISILGDASAYTDPIGALNSNNSAPAYSYSIVGGVGGGTTTFTTTTPATFGNNATVSISDITFSGCTAAFGAAMQISAGKVQVRNCKFLDCLATGLSTNGGAIDVASTGVLYLDKCYFKDNYRSETEGAASATNSGLGYDIGAVAKTTTLCMHNCTIDNSKLGLKKTTGNKTFLPNAGSIQTKGVTLIVNSTFKGAGNSGRGCYSIGYNGVADGDPDKAIICNCTLTHASQPSIWSKAGSDAYSLKYDYCLVKSVSLASYPEHIITGANNATGDFTMGADSGNGYFAAPTLPGGYSAPTKLQLETVLNNSPAWTAFHTWLGDEWGKDQSGASRGLADSSVWKPGSIQ